MELTATIQQQVFVNLLWFRSDISISYIGLLIADMSSGKGKGLSSKAKGGNNFLDQINETKRKREKEKEKDRKERKLGPKSTNPAHQSFLDLLNSARPADVIGEFCWFKKKLPVMLEHDKSELIRQVRGHMRIKEMKKAFLEDDDNEMILAGENFPLLDALSVWMGVSLQHIIAPPTTKCLLCNKKLSKNNKPTLGALHQMSGPTLATKYSYECRHCPETFSFRNQQETNKRVYYQFDIWGNPSMGYRHYDNNLYYRSSTEELFDKRFLEAYMNDLHLKLCCLVEDLKMNSLGSRLANMKM